MLLCDVIKCSRRDYQLEVHNLLPNTEKKHDYVPQLYSLVKRVIVEQLRKKTVSVFRQKPWFRIGPRKSTNIMTFISSPLPTVTFGKQLLEMCSVFARYSLLDAQDFHIVKTLEFENL